MIVKSVTCKLRTNSITADALADTMAKFNAACNALSRQAWDTETFRVFDLHRLAYHATRAEFGLPAQLTVRALAKVCDTYKTDRSVMHTFGPRGAVVFDARCFKLKGVSSAELTTTQGRFSFSLAHGGKQREQLLAGTTGEADLLFRDGNYYLSISVKTPDPPRADTSGGVLGVDMGIVEIATDSGANSYSGEPVKSARIRLRTHRRQLQSRQTNSAKKRLRRIARKQSRFVRDTNHVISKKIVQTALLAAKALALETLAGIRERASVMGCTMRWLMGNWAFLDLAAKIAYKAAEVGIPVIYVDPRNTSRTCSDCGYCDKANRQSQSRFKCLECGSEFNADFNAAKNIGTRAELSTRLLSSVPATG